jgi:plastocyanin
MPAVRRPRLVPLASLTALTLALAACSSTGSAGWTYAPQPSITPAPSPSAFAATSSAPSGSATPNGSAAPSGSAAPGASGGSTGTTGTTVNVVALNIAFDNAALQAAAGQAFVIAFDNQDSGIPHNIEIKDAGGASAFKGEIITGPAKATYQIPALTAGSYTFICDVHPNMTGTLTVQ